MSVAVSQEQKFRTEVRRWVMRVKRPRIEFLRLVLNQPSPNALNQWHVKDFSVESLVDDIVRTIVRSKAGDHLLVLEGFQKAWPRFGTPSDQSYTLCRHDFAVAPDVVTPEVARAAEAAVGVVDAVSAFVVKYDDDPFTHIGAWMSKLSAPPLAELQLHTAVAQPGTMAPFPALVTMLPTPEGEWSPPASVARQFIDIASAFFREKFSAGQKCTFIVRGLCRYPAEASMTLQSSLVRESRFTIEAFARRVEEAAPSHPFDRLGNEFNRLDELAFLKLALERAGGHPADSWKEGAMVPRLRWELVNWVTEPRPLSEKEIAAGRAVAKRLDLRAELFTILRRWNAQRLVKRIQLACDAATPDGSTVLRALRYWSDVREANEDGLVKLARDIVSEVEEDQVTTKRPLHEYSLLGFREDEDIYHTRWHFPREPGRRDALPLPVFVPVDPNRVKRDQESKAIEVGVSAVLGVKEPEVKSIPMLLWCPACGERHIDAGEFAVKPHHTHACQECGMVWRPALVPTCGVAFLPGFKNL